MSNRRSSKSARNVFARNVGKLRRASGYSQEYLAERAGLHRTYIGAVERGEANISLDRAEALAKALGVPLVDLLKAWTNQEILALSK